MFIQGPTDEMIGTYNLKRLLVFRSAVIASQLAVIALAVRILSVDLPLNSILSIITVYAVFNLLVWLRLRKGVSASAGEFFLHLVIDVLALAALLYFSGGSSNPFVSMFLLPLVIAAASLPRRYVWAMAAVTLSCYTLLMVINVPLMPDMGGQDHSAHGGHAGHGSAASDFGLHVLGMWFSFLLGVGLILFFVVSMAEALRQRNKKLAEAREKNLRDEHMIALGTLAAGAAHELGTPLATMAVLTREMELDYSEQPDLVEKIDILRSQVDRCKATLGQISANAGQMKADSGCSEHVKQYLQQCIGRWQEMHPNTTISVSLNGSEPIPVIVVDETLNQAIINVLNNAADASPDRIVLNAEWSCDELSIEVRDFGEGLDSTAMQELGKPFFTTKADGHGLGFYLAQEVIRRLGGEVKIGNHGQGGASIRIRLPLNKLVAE